MQSALVKFDYGERWVWFNSVKQNIVSIRIFQSLWEGWNGLNLQTWNMKIKLIIKFKTYHNKILKLQVNICEKLLFLHQLIHNMTTDCSLNYKFNTWKLQAQTWACGEHVVYRNCFWHSEQFLYTTCSPHVLQKEELLTNIFLYNSWFQNIF